MTGQRLALLTYLALLGLFLVLAEISLGTAAEDEDYYMQELLTREQYNLVQMQEVPDRHEHPSENPAKKVPKSGKQSGNRTLEKVCHFLKFRSPTLLHM